MSKRAERRHHTRRMKAKASSVSRKHGMPGWARNYNHLKVCSCWMCGNPRKYFNEKTMQERRAEGNGG